MVPGVRQVQQAHRAELALMAVRACRAAWCSRVCRRWSSPRHSLVNGHPHDPPLVASVGGVLVHDARPRPIGELAVEHVLHCRRPSRCRGRRTRRSSASAAGCDADAVVALAVVLHHELPVAVLDDASGCARPSAVHVVRREERRRGSGERLEVGGVVGEADEDVAADGPAVHRLQPELGRIEVVGEIPTAGKGPVEVGSSTGGRGTSVGAA